MSRSRHLKPICGVLLALSIALSIAAAACNDDKPRSAWPTEAPVTRTVASNPEEERVDLYGDRLPTGSIARLGSVRMLDRKLGQAIFSVDGSEIITSSEESYTIWQTVTAQRLGALDVANAAPTMAMRADGLRLATAIYGGPIQIWDYPERKAGAALSGHRKVVTALCYAGETLISGSEDRSLRIWRDGDSKPLRGDWETITAVHCRASGIVMFADGEGGVWLTDTGGAEPVRFGFANKRVDAGTAVTSVAMASDKGPFAAALADGSVAVWAAVKKQPLRFDAHEQRALKVAFTAKDKLMTSGADAAFRFWDPATGNKTGERKAAADVEAQLFELSTDGAFIVAVSELKDGRASEAGRFWLYDGKTGAQLLEPDRHTEALTAVAFSADGKKLVTAAEDGLVYVWSVADASLSRTMSRQKGPVRALALDKKDKKGRWFSVGDDARMHAARLAGSDSIVLEPIGGAVHAMALEPSGGRLITGDFAGKVYSFSRKSGARLARHDAEAFTTIHGLGFSPDGKYFAIAGGNRHVHVVSAASGKKLTLLSPKGTVAHYAVTFSPDGKLLATGGDDHVVRVWSTSSWKQLGALEGHDGTIRAVAFSRDSMRLASGSSDETARLWDVKSRSEITLLAGHRGAVTSVAFSPDGALLVTGSRDRTALVWELPALEAVMGAGKPSPAAKEEDSSVPAKDSQSPIPASPPVVDQPPAADKSDTD